MNNLSVFRNFNSKVVRLKALYNCFFRSFRAYFNSKVVRLKADFVEYVNEILDEFQFQSGAVKRRNHSNYRKRCMDISIPKWCG